MSAPRTPPVFSTPVDLRPDLTPQPAITHVVFDFDGTLSWVRHGWPDMMRNVFRRVWIPLPGEDDACREELLDSIVLGLNGRPTLVQMLHFVELLRHRGGACEAEALRVEYQGELDTAIARRLAAIRSGQVPRDAYVVHRGRAFLEYLAQTDLHLIVLSSTIEHRVREEAAALGLSHYFKNRIHGSGENPAGFSKLEVLREILRADGIRGENLLSFGDGPVELECTKQLGGTAVAICSDERENGSGVMDPVKRAQLLAAGADIALPDFRDATILVEYLCGR